MDVIQCPFIICNVAISIEIPQRIIPYSEKFNAFWVRFSTQELILFHPQNLQFEVVFGSSQIWQSFSIHNHPFAGMRCTKKSRRLNYKIRLKIYAAEGVGRRWFSRGIAEGQGVVVSPSPSHFPLPMYE